MLGAMHTASFESDPKHLGFVLRRYHFVARMLHSTGAKSVLEVGCGDMTGAPVVKAVVDDYMGIDIDNGYHGNYRVHDMTCGPLPNYVFDAAFALDVLEHIHPDDEDAFFKNINLNLTEHGTVIIGAPSLESQKYASALSKKYHVNCKDGANFRATLRRHYHNVYTLGLNDYALHDGYDQMCHYRIGLCTSKIQE